MKLTDTEKRIIEHYRNGARIEITHYRVEQYDEAMELLKDTKVKYIFNFGTIATFVGYTEQNYEVTVHLER